MNTNYLLLSQILKETGYSIDNYIELDNTLIFWKEDEHNNEVIGFKLLAVDIMGRDADETDPIFGNSVEVEVVLEVSAAFDGLRHVEFYRDSDGYGHYVNPYRMARIWLIVGELADKCCWSSVKDGDWDKDRER